MQLERETIAKQLTYYEKNEKHYSGKYHDRALRLKQFLEDPKKPISNTLTPEQFLDFTILVCELIEENNKQSSMHQLQFIKNLQSLYSGGNAFFDLFKLFSTRIMSGMICMQLANMDFTQAKLLRSQYTSYFKDITGLNAESLLAIIQTIKCNKKNSDEPDYFNELVIWLGGSKPVPPANEPLLNIHTLDLLTKHREQLASLQVIFKLLHKKECLLDSMGKVNYDYLAPLGKCTDLKVLVELLSLGSKRFDADLLRAYANHSALPTLLKTYNFFNKYPELLPHQFDILLRLPEPSLLALLTLVSVLEQLHGIVPDAYLQYAIKAAERDALNSAIMQNRNIFTMYLGFFHEKDLLDANTLVLIAENLIDVPAAYNNARQLSALGLLERKGLKQIVDISSAHLDVLITYDMCVPLIKNKFDQFLAIPESNLESFCRMIKVLQKTEEKLASQNIDALLSIKPKYYPQMARLCQEMADKQLLNDNSLQKIFSVHLKKMDQPSIAPITITEIGEGETAKSKYKKTTGKPIVFGHAPSDKTHPHGIFKDGFQKSSGKNLPWNLKIFNTPDQEKLAKKEAKYRSDVFLIQNTQKNQWEILSKTKGVSLQNTIPQHLLNIPFEYRLEALIGLLKELAGLHQMRRTHGNVRFENCVYEQEGSRKYYKLPHYEGASKIKSFFCPDNASPEYMDKYKAGEESLHLPREVRATGILIAKLFPEYMAVTRKSNDDEIVLTPSARDSPQEEPAKIRHTVISLLVADMDSDSRKSRCTMTLAASYCEQIFAKLSDLGYEDMNVIRNKTLINKSCNADDIIQDRYLQLS